MSIGELVNEGMKAILLTALCVISCGCDQRKTASQYRQERIEAESKKAAEMIKDRAECEKQLAEESQQRKAEFEDAKRRIFTEDPSIKIAREQIKLLEEKHAAENEIAAEKANTELMKAGSGQQ